MQHLDLLLQHPDENACNICLIQMKHLEHTLETYVHSHCNIDNIPICFCNTDTKHLPLKHLNTYICNMRFQQISLCWLRMKARRRVEFIGIELACRRANSPVLISSIDFAACSKLVQLLSTLMVTCLSQSVSSVFSQCASQSQGLIHKMLLIRISEN